MPINHGSHGPNDMLPKQEGSQPASAGSPSIGKVETEKLSFEHEAQELAQPSNLGETTALGKLLTGLGRLNKEIDRRSVLSDVASAALIATTGYVGYNIITLLSDPKRDAGPVDRLI